MKASYTRPSLLEYGRLESLTLGTGGNVPDYVGGQLINSTCASSTFIDPTTGGVITRTRCDNSPGTPVGS